MTDCVKCLGVYIDCKVNFHHHVDFVSSHAMTFLIRTTIFSFPAADISLILFLALVTYKLQYASVALNSRTTTSDSNLNAYRTRFQSFATVEF
jgi:hypothetical protein